MLPSGAFGAKRRFASSIVYSVFTLQRDGTLRHPANHTTENPGERAVFFRINPAPRSQAQKIFGSCIDFVLELN